MLFTMTQDSNLDRLEFKAVIKLIDCICEICSNLYILEFKDPSPPARVPLHHSSNLDRLEFKERNVRGI